MATAFQASVQDANFASSGSLSLTGLGLSSGDLIVYFVSCSGSVTQANLRPSGYSDGPVIIDIDLNLAMFYKISNGSETSIAFPGGSPTFLYRQVVSFRDSGHAFTGAAVVDSASQLTNSNPSPQVLSLSGDTPIVVVGGYAVADNIVSPTVSPTEDGSVASVGDAATFQLIKYKTYNSGPVNTTIDSGDGGSDNGLMSMALRLTPANPIVLSSMLMMF